MEEVRVSGDCPADQIAHPFDIWSVRKSHLSGPLHQSHKPAHRNGFNNEIKFKRI